MWRALGCLQSQAFGVAEPSVSRLLSSTLAQPWIWATCQVQQQQQPLSHHRHGMFQAAGTYTSSASEASCSHSSSSSSSSSHSSSVGCSSAGSSWNAPRSVRGLHIDAPSRTAAGAFEHRLSSLQAGFSTQAFLRPSSPLASPWPTLAAHSALDKAPPPGTSAAEDADAAELAPDDDQPSPARDSKAARRQRARERARAKSAGLVRCKRLNVPVGWKKLDFVLTMVRRRPVAEALAQLAVCPKKAAYHVERHMRLAKANAVQKGLNPDRLVVWEAFVNKGQYIKRPAFMGRGFLSFKEQQRTHVTIVLKEDPDARPWMRLLKPYSMARHSKHSSNSSSSSSSSSSGGKSQSSSSRDTRSRLGADEASRQQSSRGGQASKRVAAAGTAA